MTNTRTFTPDFRIFEDFHTQTCTPSKNCQITVDEENVEIEIECTCDGRTDSVSFDTETWNAIVDFVNRTQENSRRVTWNEFHDSDIDS
ncbi:MAG: hypothetical protein LUQ37_10050 [Methanoregulaceae archaeon]|jgi:hypothetical protein|nr:hypothetical protein [Methanoregulaceae archaeon]